jgi:hypothetical protein
LPYFLTLGHHSRCGWCASSREGAYEPIEMGSAIKGIQYMAA